MANFDTSLTRKGIRHRGLYAGKEQTVTGVLRVTAGQSIATTDLIRAVPLGENVRPIRLALTATPVSGNPALTNPTFSPGVAPMLTANFQRPDGTVFPALTASATALASNLVIPAGLLIATISVNRPVANNVPNYGPFFATLTPAGAGAFSVAGGDIDLALSVTFVGEEKSTGFVYTDYINQKVNTP